MNIGTKKWHESVSDVIFELAALGGVLTALALLVISFALEHHLHGR